MLLNQLKINIDEYVKRKSWYWYMPVWLVGVYIYIQVLHFNPNTASSLIILPAQTLNFFLHELAHIVTAFFPAIITASAGSFSELLLGGLLVYGAFAQRAYFASLICLLWFMLSCQSAGIYMADARAQQLNLVSLGGELSGSNTTIHDWHYVFSKLHVLGLDTFIGTTVRAVGVLAGLFGLLFTAWLMYKMVNQQDAVATEQ